MNETPDILIKLRRIEDAIRQTTYRGTVQPMVPNTWTLHGKHRLFAARLLLYTDISVTEAYALVLGDITADTCTPHQLQLMWSWIWDETLKNRGLS